MKTFNKNVELQIDKKSTGAVIRVNVNGKCKVRICQIPNKCLIDKEGKELDFINITIKETY